MPDKEEKVEEQENIAQNIFSLIVVIIVGYLIYNYLFISTAKELKLYNCGEPIAVDKCEESKGFLDCVFTNKSKVPQRLSDFNVWLYDEEGIFINARSAYEMISVPPERSVHYKFYVDENSSSGVICSLEPLSELTPVDQWKKIR